MALACGCRVFPLHSPPPPASPKAGPQARPIPVDAVLSDETIVRDDQRLYRINDKIPWTGKVLRFYPSGQREFELRYHEGLREGLSNWWSDEGWIRHERSYSAGKLNGSWIQSYESGKHRQLQYYQQGREVSRRGWWPNGQLYFEIELENGIEIHRKVWDEQGKLTRETGKPSGTSQAHPPLPQPNAAQAPPVTPEISEPAPPSIPIPSPANPFVVKPKITATPKPPPSPVSWNELEERDELYYLKNQKKPFSGMAILVAPNGGRQWAVAIKDGKLGAMTEQPGGPVDPGEKSQP